MLAFLVISLLSVPDPHWSISGPIFAGTPSGSLEKCHIGYGDRATINQGFHAGVDFGDPVQGSTGSMVLSPANMPWRAIGIPWANPGTPDDQIVCFGTDWLDDWGWSYGHIYIPNPASWYNLYASSDGTPKQELGNTTGLDWRHIHVAWVPAWYYGVPFPGIQNTYHNPFDYIDNIPSGYQSVKFAKVHVWEYQLFYDGPGRGIIVLPDGNEAFLLSPASQTEEERLRLDFQRVFRGPVDFVVNPVSAHEGERTDTCGVRKIEYSVQREDNYNSVLAQVQEPRVVFNMNGELPWSDSQNDLNFKALFADETFQWGGYTIPGPFFNNYIVTNSGVSPTGDTGLENVIDHPANVYHDWQNDVFNIGGFDTSLRSTETGGSSSIPTAFVNEHAEFPDGRYWVTIAAVTQDGLGSEIATLPAVDCYADPIVRDPAGFVIDNYYPHVDSIIVYQLSPFRVRFRGGWTTPDIARPYQELREQSALSSWTYFASGQSTLGVAVKYSERLDENNLGCVWFTGGGTTAEPIFSSLEGEDGILNPTPWRTNLGARPDSSNQYWVCYETQMNWPGYVGNIRVHIGSPDGSELPRDLAGNPIDIDPETVASPTWMSTTAGYELGHADTSHSWGDIDFWCKPNHWGEYRIRGYRLPNTPVTELHLKDDLGFEITMNVTPGPFDGEIQIFGICPDWGGFWLEHWYEHYKPPFVYIVRPTGPEEWDSFQLSIPASDDLIWSNAVNTQSGRYLFVLYKDNVVPGVSCTGHLVCYSSLPTSSGTPLGISSNQITVGNHVPAYDPQLGPTGEEIIVNWNQYGGGGGFQQTYHVSQFFDLGNEDSQSTAPLQPDLSGAMHIEDGNAVIHLSWSELEGSGSLCAGDGSQLLHQVFRCSPGSGETELLGLAYPGVNTYTDRFPAAEHSRVEYWVTAVDGGQESEPSARLLFEIPQGSNVALGKPVRELSDMTSLVTNHDAAGIRTEAQGNPWCLTDGRLDEHYQPSTGAHSVEIDLGAVHTITSVVIRRENQSSSTLSDASLAHMAERSSLSSRTDLGEGSLRARFLRIDCAEGASEILVFGREEVREQQRIAARRGGDGNWIINLPQSDRTSSDVAAESGSESLEGTLTLLDLAGRVVWTSNALQGSDVLWEGRTEAGVPAPNGIYLVHFECSGNVTTGRIMIVDPGVLSH